MCCTLPTAPALSVFPSMIEASISFVPALVKTEPRPALKCGSSSSTRTAASVASRLDPPRFRIRNQQSTPAPARLDIRALFPVSFAALNRSGAAVNRESNFLCFHVWIRHSAEFPTPQH